jgi:hypothetical protein
MLNILKHLVSTTRVGTAGLWEKVYKRRLVVPNWRMRFQKVARYSFRLLATLLPLTIAFLLGVAVPAVLLDDNGRILNGGLVDGRWVLALSVLVTAGILLRYGFPTAGNSRAAGSKAVFFLPLASLKALGAGIAVGGIALISQSPIEMAGFIVFDDYDINGDQHRKEFVELYLKQIKLMKEASLSVDVAFNGNDREAEKAVRPLKELLTQAEREGSGEVSEELADSIMIHLKLLESGPRLEERLQQLRHRLKGRRGDRVVVISLHRLPPATDLMRSCWPLPESMSAQWLCANQNAKASDPGVKEPRVLSIWVSNDPMLQPIVRVTAENSGSDPACELIWKLLPTENLKADPLKDGTFGPPISPSKAFQRGFSLQTSGVRFAWQFEMPRFAETRYLTVDLQADKRNTLLSHPWRIPVRLAPNQIRIRPVGADAEAMLKQLPDFGDPKSPLLLDQTAQPPTVGCIIATVGPLRKPPDPDIPTLELLENKTKDPSQTGRLLLLPPYRKSDLGEVTPRRGLTDDWPDLGASAAPDGSQVFAQILTKTKETYDVLFQKDPKEHPAWFTVVMPSGTMNKAAAAGHRHLVIFAASLAERKGKNRPPWRQPYLLADDSGTLPLNSGRPFEKQSLLKQLAFALWDGNMKIEVRETPGNSVMTLFAPSVPWGFTLTVAITVFFTLGIIVNIYRRNPVG